MSSRRLSVVGGALAVLVAAVAAIVVVHDTGARATRSAVGQRIPQPSLSRLNARTRHPLAPAASRVDLSVQTFSHSAAITNPLFPIGDLRAAVLLGRDAGRRWRAETTLLPGTALVSWNGQHVETRRSQFVAYLDGRIFEVAVDYYAQADDGSVWYFGEDAYSYERGRVRDTEGTWRAGTHPPAMIMPAHPRVGDVYRTENIPGLVFEQVTVKRVGVTVDGPNGPVAGAMVGQELHMDESRLEDKVFAPGYGEFHSGQGLTYEATALAVPVDAGDGPEPPTLTALARLDRPWSLTATGVARMTRAWDQIRATQPPLLAAQMSAALARLRAAIRGHRAIAAAALDVTQAGLDLALQYRPELAVDRARFALETRRLMLDARTGNAAAVHGDAATLRWIGNRIGVGTARIRRLEGAAAGRQSA